MSNSTAVRRELPLADDPLACCVPLAREPISTEQAAAYRATIDEHRAELGRTGDFSMIVSLNDAITVDDFRRAEEVGVTDLLTMPWAYYGGFKQPLAGKLDGLKRFADEVVGPLSG